MTSFSDFFKTAAGHNPYLYQRRLAEEDPLPQLLNIPTGAGKTAAVILGWLWRRRFANPKIRQVTPRRLVYCLPMRVLVEQTAEEAVKWVGNLKGRYARKLADSLPVHVLMGGEADDDWTLYPERDAILVGTQDMLLSRALNRGYAMSRYRWPIDFGLLNNDCLWVLDEVQLMGSGLETSLQLDAWRGRPAGRRRWPIVGQCASIWMSATVPEDSFTTVDREDQGLANPAHDLPRSPLKLSAKDLVNKDLKRRHFAEKSVKVLQDPPDGSDILSEHAKRAGQLTLVIANTVRSARGIHESVLGALGSLQEPKRKEKTDRPNDPLDLKKEHVLLLHSHFRPLERQQIAKKLTDFKPSPGSGPGLLVVSTQVVEAGVDVSASVLWSEIAPWPSVVQRLGRLNRDGLTKKAVAWFWEPKAGAKKGGKTDEGQGNKGLEPKKDPYLPYTKEDVLQAKRFVGELARVRPAAFRKKLDKINQDPSAQRRAPEPVIRAPDLFELFDTDPDLYGGFTDISRYVRSTDRDEDAHVYWREFDPKAQPSSEEPRPAREELCPVPFYHLSEFLARTGDRAWEWDDESRRWQQRTARVVRRDSDIRPGMVLLLSRKTGGYSKTTGWTGAPGNSLDAEDVEPSVRSGNPFLDDDPGAGMPGWQSISDHTHAVVHTLKELLSTLDLDLAQEWKQALLGAARWHDLGKAHQRWQDAVHRHIGELRARAMKHLQTSPDAPQAEFIRIFVEEVLDAGDGSGIWAKFPDLISALRRSSLTREQRLEVWKKLRVPFRPGLRHECASALAARQTWLSGDPIGLNALTIYLITAHHGKVRLSLRTNLRRGDLPPERLDDRNAFGLEEGDVLPDVDLGGGFRYTASGQVIDLECMEIGDIERRDAEGNLLCVEPSWTRMVLDLLGPCDPRQPTSPFRPGEPHSLGPFTLAYLEAVLRCADARASRGDITNVSAAGEGT